MRRVLSDSQRNQCFAKRPDPICGDPIISGFADPCCEPTGTDRQCRVKSGIECHPREGLQ